eukprot:UN06372
MEEIGKFHGNEVIPDEIVLIMLSFYPITTINWNKDLINMQTSEINIRIHESFLHLSGHINFKKSLANNYEQIGEIVLKELCPTAETVQLQPLKGVWGSARLTWNKHGIISIKPRKSVWLNASIYFPTQYVRKKAQQKMETL